VKDRFTSIGLETVGSTPAQLTSAIRGEMERLNKVIRDRGIRAQ
jgi:tripartite-type tricarboxylate transporter receptor subunit TctC